MTSSTEKMQSVKWNLAQRENVNIPTPCKECILYVNNCTQHGDDGNCDVKTEKFNLYNKHKNEIGVKNKAIGLR
jgi:hypothetical protein